MNRTDGRSASEPRPLTIQRNYTKYSAGSVLISTGDTKVLCTASIENRIPHFLKDCGQGWLTAEYSLLPSSTHTRAQREVSKGKASGRTNEIQRLIGRSLRAAVDMTLIGERTIHIDCDVLQADGGTRTASVTGAMIALADACDWLQKQGMISKSPLLSLVTAVSVGIVDGHPVCDLTYDEDSRADVDMNIVMADAQRFVEVQGTAEKAPYSRDELEHMLALGQNALAQMNAIIRATVPLSI